MSKQIDLTKPLSEEDRGYLQMMGRLNDIRNNDARFSEDYEAPEAREPSARADRTKAAGLGEGDLAAQAGGPQASLVGDNEEPEPDANYEEWKVDELRSELAERELSQSGKKDELVARLREDDAASQEEDEE